MLKEFHCSAWGISKREVYKAKKQREKGDSWICVVSRWKASTSLIRGSGSYEKVSHERWNKVLSIFIYQIVNHQQFYLFVIRSYWNLGLITFYSSISSVGTLLLITPCIRDSARLLGCPIKLVFSSASSPSFRASSSSACNNQTLGLSWRTSW